MDCRRELMCCLFTFDVPKTEHVCFESIFGRDLMQQTIQHLQHLSMSNSQMKIVLSSNAPCRYIRPAVEDYLHRLVALQASLKKAKSVGYVVKVVNAPHFEWTSAVEQKDCCDRDVKYSDPTITFQMILALFALAVAGNANDAPRQLPNVLSLSDEGFRDFVNENKNRLIKAAGILHFLATEVAPTWRPQPPKAGSEKPAIPLECCPNFLEALAFVFEAQAYQVTVAMTAKTSDKKEVLARMCLGITRRYQQALEALATCDPNGVPLIDRIRPGFKVYIQSMRYIVNGIALMFLAESTMKPSGGSSDATGPVPQKANLPKAYALFLRAQHYATIAQDLVFEARTWSPSFFENPRRGPDASFFGSLYQPGQSKGQQSADDKPATKKQRSEGEGSIQEMWDDEKPCNALPDGDSKAAFENLLDRQSFALNEMYCVIEKHCMKLKASVSSKQLSRHTNLVLPNAVVFNETPYSLPAKIEPYSFLPFSTQQRALKLHYYQAQHASRLQGMRQQGDKFKLLSKQKCFELKLPDRVHEGQIINLETPEGLVTQIVVPPGAKPGQRVRIKTPIVSFGIRVPQDVKPNSKLTVKSPVGSEMLQLQIPPGVKGGQQFNYHI